MKTGIFQILNDSPVFRVILVLSSVNLIMTKLDRRNLRKRNDTYILIYINI